MICNNIYLSFFFIFSQTFPHGFLFAKFILMPVFYQRKIRNTQEGIRIP